MWHGRVATTELRPCKLATAWTLEMQWESASPQTMLCLRYMNNDTAPRFPRLLGMEYGILAKILLIPLFIWPENPAADRLCSSIFHRPCCTVCGRFQDKMSSSSATLSLRFTKSITVQAHCPGFHPLSCRLAAFRMVTL
jgi:hypothetical protein